MEPDAGGQVFFFGAPEFGKIEERRELVGRIGKPVVVADRADDCGRKVPALQDGGAAIGVREASKNRLSFLHWATLPNEAGVAGLEVCRQSKHDQLANVMKEARQKSFGPRGAIGDGSQFL